VDVLGCGVMAFVASTASIRSCTSRRHRKLTAICALLSHETRSLIPRRWRDRVAQRVDAVRPRTASTRAYHYPRIFHVSTRLARRTQLQATGHKGSSRRASSPVLAKTLSRIVLGSTVGVRRRRLCGVVHPIV